MTDAGFTYGSLATLLQFSLGANLAFATVLTLYDKVLVRKQKTISDLKNSAVRIKEEAASRSSPLSAREQQAIQDVDRLALDVSRFAKKLESVTYDFFRYVAIVCAFLALGLLVYAVYNASDSATIAVQIATFATIAPLLAFSAYALFWTSFKMWRFDKRRNRLDLVLAGAAAGQPS